MTAEAGQIASGYATRDQVAAAGASEMGLIAQNSNIGSNGTITVGQIIASRGKQLALSSPHEGPRGMKPTASAFSVNRMRPMPTNAPSGPRFNFGRRSNNYNALNAAPQKKKEAKPTLAQITASPTSSMARKYMRQVTIGTKNLPHPLQMGPG